MNTRLKGEMEEGPDVQPSVYHGRLNYTQTHTHSEGHNYKPVHTLAPHTH